jgi:homopolymeric O-antigen transport system permease protein
MTVQNQPTVIGPETQGLLEGIRELWRYRSLSAALAVRSFRVRYRQTVVGVAWALIQPLTLMVVFTVFFSLIAHESFYGMPYPVFFLCALTVWLPATKVLNEGTISIIANSQLVTRIYLPRAHIPLSVAFSTLIDLGFSLLALEIILLRYGYLPSLTYLAIPFLVLVAYATALGLAFMTSTLNAVYRDIEVMLPFLVQIWFFASPLLYPSSAIPEQFQPLYYLNPMALVFTGMRWAVAGSPAPPEYAWVLGFGISAALLIAGFTFFQKRASTLSDVL